MYERNTIGGTLDMEQTTRVMYGLDKKESSYLISARGLQAASEENRLSTERIQGRDYTKIGKLKTIN